MTTLPDRPAMIRIETTLPSGPVATALVRKDSIVVAIDGGRETPDRRVVAAHRRWMTRGQAAVLAADLRSVSTEGDL